MQIEKIMFTVDNLNYVDQHMLHVSSLHMKLMEETTRLSMEVDFYHAIILGDGIFAFHEYFKFQ